MNTVKVLNPLVDLHKFGQSVWFDYVRRSLIDSGELARMVKEDGLRGVTSNPSIFEKAIAGSNDYDQALKALATKEVNATALFEDLAVDDIQRAADVLRSVYDESKGADGFVSLEVSPYLANDTDATINEARRLWQRVSRPNVMIKVPGTKAGVPAVEKLISEGININVTLLFSQEVYRQVANAFVSGLEAFASKGGDVSKVASVASFFVSRIDTAVDTILNQRLEAAKTDAERKKYSGLLGKVAIANAKLAYQIYKNLYNQDPLADAFQTWCKTAKTTLGLHGTKNPSYPDTLYVDALIGPDTVNTVPPATFDAYRDHGKPSSTLTTNVDKARDVMEEIKTVGINMSDVCDKLTEEGVKLFADAFDKLLSAIDKKREALHSHHLDTITYHLDGELTKALHEMLDQFKTEDKVRRLWAGDASLWTNTDESKWLGWLGITYDQVAHIKDLQDLQNEVKAVGYKHALLLGMGGSSLGPEVLKLTFGHIDGYPELLVLDSTDPAQISTFEKKIALEKTIFIVSSKSGSTLEPNIFKQYFFEKLKAKVGADKAGKQFIAITDPGSKLEAIAKADGFGHIFRGLPSIGGRYSVLSNFGMVPAAVLGLDLTKLLERTELMVHSCAATVPSENNPGVILGAILGVSAKRGRDKITIIASPAIADLGAWLEQLLAESTGKIGKGLIPVDAEPLSEDNVYGKDRLFTYVRLKSKPDAEQDRLVDKLIESGQPVARLTMEEIYDIGQEFFRWEIATAVAGSIIGINAFNQPDVEASKVATRNLTTEYEKTGKLPAEEPFFEEDGIKLFSDPANVEALKKASNPKTLVDYLKAHFNRLQPGDYAAFLAYIEMNPVHRSELEKIRLSVRNQKKVATCLGFGPRFLHSTGQAYKGGPNSGVFLQITADDAQDLPVPGQKYTFGVVKAAQARGDFQVLTERKRRALRIHLPKDVQSGLKKLHAATQKAI